jgi:hypothetical protein
MKKSTVLNIAGLAAGVAMVAFLSQGQFASAGSDMTAEARTAYTGCLSANYRTGQAAGPRLLMEAYRKCKDQEQDYKSGLVQAGFGTDKIMDVIERVNEATMARQMGVAPSEVKGWGCIRPHEPKKFVVS